MLRDGEEEQAIFHTPPSVMIDAWLYFVLGRQIAVITPGKAAKITLSTAIVKF